MDGGMKGWMDGARERGSEKRAECEIDLQQRPGTAPVRDQHGLFVQDAVRC